MVRPTHLRLRRQLAFAALSVAAVAAPAAHGSPWNGAAALSAWQIAGQFAGQFGVNFANGCQSFAAPRDVAAPLSALDRIKMKQAGLAAPSPARSAVLPGGDDRFPTLQPAAVSFGCQRIAPQPSQKELGRSTRIAGSSGDFLASTILPVRRTGFDAQWDRVRTRSAGQAHVRAAWLTVDAGATRRDMVAAVNRWVNGRVRFAEDASNYGQSDYWADAAETLRRGKGDCEDYAIAKMQILAEMGIAREDMFLTLARDNIRRADHAVLVVRLEGLPLVLDNGSDALLDGSVANDFQPVYSFSGDRRFLHGY